MEKTGLLRIFLNILLLLIFPTNAVAGQTNDPLQAVINHMGSQEFQKLFNASLEKAGKHLEKSKQKTDATVKKNTRKLAPTLNNSKHIIQQTFGNKKVNAKEELLIFLSESMPEHEIRRFLTGGLKLMHFNNVKFVFYGFPQKGVIDQYAENHQRNIFLSIDPFLYEEHHIARVPVVIFGDYRVDAPLNLSEALDLIGEKSGIDFSDMKYELQLP